MSDNCHNRHNFLDPLIERAIKPTASSTCFFLSEHFQCHPYPGCKNGDCKRPWVIKVKKNFVIKTFSEMATTSGVLFLSSVSCRSVIADGVGAASSATKSSIIAQRTPIHVKTAESAHH